MYQGKWRKINASKARPIIICSAPNSVKFDVMVTLVTFGVQTSYTINSLCFGGFLNERLIFFLFFCKGPSDLRKYVLTAVRGLKPSHRMVVR